MKSKPRILLVEDDQTLAQLLKAHLEAESYLVDWADSNRGAKVFAQSSPPDLVILDLGLVDGDGKEFLAQFKRWSQASVLVLSARLGEEEKVKSLDLGADDYLSKPFGTAELSARLRALLRRAHPSQSQEEICFGEIKVNLELEQVFRAGELIHLTQIEYRLLRLFLDAPAKVLSHKHLLTQVWGPNHAYDTHYLRIYMKNLRQKLEIEPLRPRHFVTELGAGYRFLIEDDHIPRAVT